MLLLDEIEKAHADVFNILLQILDDGRLTDAQGRTVDFKNSVIIMTSNMGAERIQAHTRREETFEELKEDMLQVVRHHLRPEFVNRIDEIIVFRALSREQIVDIARLLLERTTRRLRAQDIEVEFTDEAVELIAEEGFEPEYGRAPCVAPSSGGWTSSPAWSSQALWNRGQGCGKCRRGDSPSMSYRGGHFRCRVSDEYGREKPRRPDRGSLRSGRGSEPEHTDVHRIGSRLMELLQDVAVLLLNVTLLGMGFVFLYRVWREIRLRQPSGGSLEHHPRGDHHRALPALCPLPQVPPRESEPPGRGGVRRSSRR